jgi:heme/copper-type cytochrome/quinol oxidase subunit 2
MRYDRILILLAGIFFIIFSFVIRFVIIGHIKKSDKRTAENKKREIRRGKGISIFLLVIAIYWIVLFIFYNKLF